MPEREPHRTILVVDDDQSVMRLVTATLSGTGYDVLTAEDGKVGLDLFAAHANEILLVLTDIAMPVMGGIAMAERILALRPDVRILLMTGYSETIVGDCSQKLALIRKPFLPGDLLRKIRSVLGSPRSMKDRARPERGTAG